LAAGVVSVKIYASVTLDAAIHLVVDKRPEVLILIGSLAAPVPAAGMASHHRHVLQVTLTSFVTDRAVVWMVDH
jgi:hypothetical protein